MRKSTGAIGTTKLLKVMAGDRIHAKVDYYFNAANANNSGTDPVGSFVSSLMASLTHTATVAPLLKGEATAVTNQLQSSSVFTNFINPSPSQSGAGQAPKAYLCVLFFDERFQFDEVSSRVVPVDYAPGVKSTIDRTFAGALTAGKNGYVYVYFTNESDELVYMDNFMLSHERGALLEETHYYPFGLTMQGISSKAMGGVENRFKFGGKELQSNEFSDNSGLELYDFGAREQDPQLGRWWTVDPKAEKYYSSSPCNFVDNNPITRVDPTGKDWFYYQAKGEEKKTWHYHEGHKAKYTNDKGKEKTIRNGYSHLVAFVSNGRVNSDGAKMGTLVVYNQDKVQMTAPGAFTGGGGNPAVNNGMYMMRMDIKDREEPKEMNAARDNPATTHGAQKIPNRYIQVDGQPTNTPTMDAYDVGGAWGRGRVRLNNVDENLKIIQTPNDRGAFLHGKLRTDINYTHGCICDRSEAVFDYLWNNVNSKVPLIVE